jgi:hypothetical protein
MCSSCMVVGNCYIWNIKHACACLEQKLRLMNPADEMVPSPHSLFFICTAPPARVYPLLLPARVAMASSPTGVWSNGVEEAMEAGSPGRLLEALALGPRGASEASPARRSWADLDGDSLPPPGDFFAGSPSLLRAFLDRGPVERVALSDSEVDSDPEPSPSLAPSSSASRPPPLPPVRLGLEAGEPSRRRRTRHRRRRHGRRPRGPPGPARQPPPAPGRPCRGGARRRPAHSCFRRPSPAVMLRRCPILRGSSAPRTAKASSASRAGALRCAPLGGTFVWAVFPSEGASGA